MKNSEIKLNDLEMSFRCKVYCTGKRKMTFSASTGYLEAGDDEALSFRYQAMKLMFESLGYDMASDFLFEEIEKRYDLDVYRILECRSDPIVEDAEIEDVEVEDAEEESE
jgi:hypothetical protein